MTRTLRKQLNSARIRASVKRRHLKSPASAADLLRDEARRLHALGPIGNLRCREQIVYAKHALDVAACWLDARTDPAMVRQWKEVEK